MCSTWASRQEVKDEARWAVRGGWIKYTGGRDIYDHYRPSEEKPEVDLKLQIPKHLKMIKRIHFLHLFSGMKRQGDLEWYLVRLGAKAGYEVKVISIDLAYGVDLADKERIDRLVQLARKGRFGGFHNGAPCSTWSRVRFLDGGPPPLRTRASPWGRPCNSRAQQEHTDLHSLLWRNSMRVLEAVALSGGVVTNEHPRDPGRDPFPSTWNLPEMRRIERE